jgi:glycosyltransferase involved in cell wall biosynthesis
VVVSHTADVGGAEIALLRLLRARDRAAFDISAIVLEEGDFAELLRADGVPTEVIATAGLSRVTRGEAASSIAALWRNTTGSIATARTMRRMLRQVGAELVVANSLKSAVVVSLARPRGVPWVWHLHDRLASDYMPGPLVAGLRILARIGPRRVVVNSRATARTVGALPAGRVVVAYPGLPPEAFVDDRAAGDAEESTVGIVGRISVTKGQRIFLGAARRVLANIPGVHFRIIGGALFEDAAEEKGLRELAEASPELRGSVEWTGWVADTRPALRNLTLAVHASPIPEPFGQVIVEAMATGVPVIGADSGGVPEIIDPGASAVEIIEGVHRSALGLLVRAGDEQALARAIQWALENPADARAMASAARKSAQERYGIEQTWVTVAGAWTDALAVRSARTGKTV